jgi:hypothetical protein
VGGAKEYPLLGGGHLGAGFRLAFRLKQVCTQLRHEAVQTKEENVALKMRKLNKHFCCIIMTKCC